MQTPDNENNDPIQQPVKDYAKYAGMAIKMGATITLAVLLGQWLDKKWPLSTETPIYTVICSLLGVGLALYSTLKELIGKS